MADVTINSVQADGRYRLDLTKTGDASAHLTVTEEPNGGGAPTVNDFDLTNILVAGDRITCDGPRVLFITPQVIITMEPGAVEMQTDPDFYAETFPVTNVDEASLRAWLAASNFPRG